MDSSLTGGRVEHVDNDAERDDLVKTGVFRSIARTNKQTNGTRTIQIQGSDYLTSLESNPAIHPPSQTQSQSA